MAVVSSIIALYDLTRHRRHQRPGILIQGLLITDIACAYGVDQSVTSGVSIGIDEWSKISRFGDL